jgi:hypothetical protein
MMDISAGLSLEVETRYYWKMARGLFDARRAEDSVAAGEYLEALEMLRKGDNASIRKAASSVLLRVSLPTQAVVLHLPTARRNTAPKRAELAKRGGVGRSAKAV